MDKVQPATSDTITGFFSPNTIKSLGEILSFGTIGLGLSLAICATLLMLFKKENGWIFLVFSTVIVGIGAVLETLRQNELSAQAKRKFSIDQTLPDELWNDFLSARHHAVFLNSKPLPTNISGYLKQDERKTLSVSVPDSCLYYAFTIKPPANIIVSIDPTDVIQTTMTERDYFKSAKICLPEHKIDKNVKITGQAIGNSGQYSVAFFNPPSLDVINDLPDGPDVNSNLTPEIPSTKSVALSKIVCTGEFEGGCPGGHDLWVPCGSGEEQIAQQICGSTKSSFRRVFTRGGNRCGYAVLAVTCS